MTLKALPLTDETREMLMRAYDVLLSATGQGQTVKRKSAKPSKPWAESKAKLLSNPEVATAYDALAILTIPQVADYLQLSKSKVYGMVTRNEIPYIRIGKNVRVRQGDLQEWLAEQTKGTRPIR